MLPLILTCLWALTNLNDPSYRIDAFELWCWRRLLRVFWTARRSNQSILKEISPEYSLEWLMLKLKLQYFYHLMWRTDTFEKTLMLGKIVGKRRRGRQRMRWLDGNTNSMDMNLSKLWELVILACCSPWGHKQSDTTEWLIWTESSFSIRIRSIKKMCVTYILYIKLIWLIMFNFYIMWSVFSFYISFGEGNVKKY